MEYFIIDKSEFFHAAEMAQFRQLPEPGAEMNLPKLGGGVRISGKNCPKKSPATKAGPEDFIDGFFYLENDVPGFQDIFRECF